MTSSRLLQSQEESGYFGTIKHVDVFQRQVFEATGTIILDHTCSSRKKSFDVSGRPG